MCIATLGSLVSSLLYLKRILHEKQKISMIVAQAAPALVKDLHASLDARMRLKKIRVLISDAISSPCIIGKAILFPTQLFQELSQKETEAIIAHEMAHFCWRDCSIRIVCSLVACLFWWIPTKSVQKRIENAQEEASDAAIYRFGISGTILANAILKTAREIKRLESQLAFSFVGGKSLLRKRTELLFENSAKFYQGNIVQYGLLCGSWLSILFGRLWTF